jgi:hypothetical protein
MVILLPFTDCVILPFAISRSLAKEKVHFMKLNVNKRRIRDGADMDLLLSILKKGVTK